MRGFEGYLKVLLSGASKGTLSYTKILQPKTFLKPFVSKTLQTKDIFPIFSGTLFSAARSSHTHTKQMFFSFFWNQRLIASIAYSTRACIPFKSNQ